jgi:hypothetical protein
VPVEQASGSGPSAIWGNSAASDLLLAEFIHRSANDLAVACAEVRIASRVVTPPSARVRLERVVTRLQALAAIQRLLQPRRTPAIELGKARQWAEGWQYAGYKMTVFSATEEKVIEDTILHARIYFDIPYALTLAGASVTTGPNFEPYVIEDRELITGQDPRSDHPIGKALIAALDRMRGAA